ncbi:hypothetical protein G5B47_04015 [Paenibacillus sp. 7124]|uniref:Uncharacterized protein n=1 Tax=Paenibacillus apii TaxID=1850370 RepID=A0A6M1PHZ7_9BACL|nr:hypothetical protein [Paenibacillus apii]NGM81573.1 hypothetical protein [Paenibacillus apii]NJJ41407.1 hypothetical protein [Paenibacillus apii]
MDKRQPQAGRTAEELQDVTLLGNKGNRYVFEYAPEVLEAFANKHPDLKILVSAVQYRSEPSSQNSGSGS